MKTGIYNVLDINEYWQRLDKNLEINLTNMLRDRYEYGTSEMCSEAGIQKSLVYYAAKIAQNEGLNVAKTRCICQAVGLCFPEKGSVGLQIIKEYLAHRNLDGVDVNCLEIDVIETKIRNDGSVVTRELDEALHMYYNGSSQDPEVNVARYCHIKLQSARELMKKGVFAGEAITTIMEKAVVKYDRNRQYALETILLQIPEEVRLEVENDVKEALSFGKIEDMYLYVL